LATLAALAVFAAPLGCKLFRRPAAAPPPIRAAPLPVAPTGPVAAARPPPPRWVRKVVPMPPLGHPIEIAQIVLTSQQTGAPWVPARGRKRTAAEALALARRLAAKARAGADFTRLAIEFSDWPFADRVGTPGYGGRLGLLTEGGPGLPASLVKAAFGLKIGQVSDPVESPFGYHVLKRLPLQRASEILLTYRGASGPPRFDRTHAEAVALAAKIEADLASGKPFADEAQAYSDDLASAGRGGDLGAFDDRSALLPQLREAVGKLAVGKVSKPLETPPGLLILQRTE
jgi:hypothetical protein